MPDVRLRRFRSLDFKLLALVWSLLLLVIAGYTWATWREVREAARSAASERLTRVSDELARVVSMSTLDALGGVTNRAEIQDFLSNPESDTAERAVRGVLAELDAPQTIEISLFSADGRVRTRFAGTDWDATLGHSAVAPGPQTLPARGQASVEAAGQTKERIASGTRGALRTVGNRVFYDRSVPVISDDGLLGTVVERRLVAPVAANFDGIEALIGSDAVFLFGNASGDLWTDLRGIVSGPAATLIDAGVARTYARDGLERFGLAISVTGTPFAILVEFPLATVLAPASGFLFRSLTISVVLLLVATASAVVLGRRVFGPIHELGRAARAIADGDYSHRVTIRSQDEIGALAESFNHMAQEVESARADDSTRRMAAERARERSEEYFRALVQNSLDIVTVVDRTGKISFANASTRSHLGYDPADLTGSQLCEFVHSSDWPEVDLALGDSDGLESTREVELRWRRNDGAWRNLRGIACDLRHNPVINGVLLNLRDVTDRLHLEQELRQAHKMEAVGRLAGGIAHDFNNLLTAMTGNLDFVRQDPDLSASALEDLDQVSAATARAAQLVRQLLAFGRRQAILPTHVDPNEVIRDLSRMLARLVGERVRVETVLDPDAGHIEVDRIQLEQVLLNLAINARDAMPEGGTLTLTTTQLRVNGQQTTRLQVCDDGVGMDEATREHIFEPFFTTKPEGVGTGLGLATVYGILSQSGATVAVTSVLGEGTTFDVRFASVDADATIETSDSPPAPLAAEPQESASILVTEDQAGVATFVQRALRSRGFTVRFAGTVREAVEVLRAAETRFDLLLTDVGLPDGRGPALADQARELQPGIRVLFMTGYDRERVSHRLEDPVIEKPFTLKELYAAVDKRLAAHATGGQCARRAS